MKLLVVAVFCFVFGSPASADESNPLEVVIQTIQTSQEEMMREALLRGLLKGLEGKRQVQTPRGWSQLSDQLSTSGNERIRAMTIELSQIFGDVRATEKALATLGDESADSGVRRKALFSLLRQKNEEASDLLESLLDTPDLTLDAIRGYAVMENAIAPSVLISRYADFDSTQQQAVCETLASRRFYAEALVDAIDKRVVAKEQIPRHVARALNELLGERFERTFGKLQPLGGDREKLLTRYKEMLTEESLAKASAEKGRAVYKKTCANCHLLYDDGGDIGPELTGSNRANLDYILLNSVDPSYDVPEGYRTIVVATTDGRLVMGVLAEEDDSKLVLKTVEEPRLVIPKSEIEDRKVSEKSMMPEGQLDQMKPQEVIDLIKYLRTTEQVEVAK